MLELLEDQVQLEEHNKKKQDEVKQMNEIMDKRLQVLHNQSKPKEVVAAP